MFYQGSKFEKYGRLNRFNAQSLYITKKKEKKQNKYCTCGVTINGFTTGNSPGRTLEQQNRPKLITEAQKKASNVEKREKFIF